MKKNGLKQIALTAGCSCSTVSRVLNNRNNISEPTRKKIMSIARNMDYENCRKQKIIALLSHLDRDGFDNYSMQLLRMIGLALQEAGFKVEVLFDKNIDILGEHYAHGAISLMVFNRLARYWGTRFRIPLVCVNDFSNLPENIYSVYSDDTKAISDGIGYLQSRGHYKICFLGPEDRGNNLNIISRIKAAKEFTRQTGIQKSCKFISIAGPRVNLGMDEFVRQIPAGCTAAVSLTEDIALRLCESLSRFRPEIELLTWTYPWEAKLLPDQVSFLQQDFQGLAENAVRMLTAQLNKKPVRNIALPYIFRKAAKHEKNQKNNPSGKSCRT